MENLSEQEQSILKQAQEAILKNLSTLNDAERANVYSKFQAIKYKKLDFFDAYLSGIPRFNSAFYAPEEKAVVIIDSEFANNFNKHILVHELLHGITANNTENKYVTGFSSSEIQRLKNKTMLCVNQNVAINEGCTEFFTRNFIDDYNSRAYLHFVQIVKHLSEACGYEELKELYFSNNVEKLKETIKTAFHLPNLALVERLFEQMDYADIYSNKKNFSKDLFITCSCYKTLLKMEMIRYKAENPNQDFTKDKVNEFFNSLKNYYTSEDIKVIVSNILQNFSEIKKQDSLKNINNDKLVKLTSTIIYAIVNNDESLKNKLKDNFSEDVIDVLYKLNSGWGVMKCDENIEPTDIIDKYLTLLHNKDEKISLSNFNSEQKYEIILNAMAIKDGYKHFCPKDLINFVNNGLDEYKFFLNRDAMEYIYLNVKNINDDIKMQEDFDRVYQQVKLDCGYALELQQKEKEEQTL